MQSTFSAHNNADDMISASSNDIAKNKDKPWTATSDHSTETDDHSTIDSRASGGAVAEKNTEVPRLQNCQALRKLKDEEDPEVAEFFRQLLEEGTQAPCDNGVSLDDRPSWLDEDKLRRGQQFTQNYFSGLVLIEVLGMILLFVTPGGSKALIFSGNADTPSKTARRYRSTLRRVQAWYTGDLWAADGEARRQLRVVRLLHAAYSRRLRDASPDERARRTTLPPPLLTRGSADAVKRDFSALAAGQARCPFFSTLEPDHVWINQMEMALTQWMFVGLMVTYPGHFGAGGASTEELDAFVHLWSVVGHLLGIEERFNFCAGGLDTVRKRSHALLHRFLLPALAHAGDDWEHMARCIVIPPLPFEVVLLYLCEMVGVETPHVLKWLSAKQLTHHRWLAKVLQWVMRWLLRVTPVRAVINWHLLRALESTKTSPPEKKVEAHDTTTHREASRKIVVPSFWLYVSKSIFFLVVTVQIIHSGIWAY